MTLPAFITCLDVRTDLHLPVISARELHGFLGSNRKFADWIKYRITQYGFEEGVDYVIHKIVNNSEEGGRPTLEYIITPHMAKELGMLENNSRGKAIRSYFISCEQQLVSSLRSQIASQHKLLNDVDRIVIKRNSLADLSIMLGVPSDVLLCTLCVNGYCDASGFPTSTAKGHFDCIGNEIRWSLPLVMRLLKLNSRFVI